MKKYIIIGLILLSSITVYASFNKFSIDYDNLSFITGKKDDLINEFDESYKITSKVENLDSELIKTITNLSKKTTTLLLGNKNNNETGEEYYKRYQEYLLLRYNPPIPHDSTTKSGYDEKSTEYNDYIVSGTVLPKIFDKINELDIKYQEFSNIEVSEVNDMIMSIVSLNDVILKKEDSLNPMQYNKVKTDLKLYYFYKKLNNEYKLFYLYGEVKDEFNSYLNKAFNNEKKNIKKLEDFNTNLNDIYDYSKLNNIKNDDLLKLYDNNINNIFYLNTYYNAQCIKSAHGFLISNGIIITTWDYLNESLQMGQYIGISDSSGNTYDIDGIITISTLNNIALLKLKDEVNANIVLGNKNDIKINMPVFTINTKMGVNMLVSQGIILNNSNYLYTSLMISDTDQGSPIYNINGEVIGMNTNYQVNSSISSAINIDVLNDIKNKFNNVEFNEISFVSFNELKEKYFYNKKNDELIKNDLDEKVWNEYKKIGNIEENIGLELVKASYQDNIVSLRYKNELNKYFDTLMITNDFRDNLVENGYKEILNSTDKLIYSNNDYKVIIMNEFDYLIIVMVKL